MHSQQQFDLRSGETLRIGSFKVTLLEIEDGAAVLEIEGPDGEIQIEPVSFEFEKADAEQEAVLV